MKKFLLAILASLSMGVSAWAQDSAEYSVSIELTSGESISYLFKDCPSASFIDKDIMFVSSKNDQGSYFLISEVARMVINSKSVGVEGINADNTVEFSMVDNVIYAANLPAGADVRVFALNGTMEIAAQADGEGRAEINVRDLAPGMHILSAGNISFKFRR